jgi:uncharacterized protein (DUF2147 family)
MHRFVRLTAMACAVTWLAAAGRIGPAFAARPEQPPHPNQVLGEWTTQDGNGVIAIEPCGQDLCGRIVGIRRAPGEPIPKDVSGASQCGLTIISKEKPDGNGNWVGEIRDPRDGSTYGAKIWVDEDGNLRLRGYLGVPLFGQTQTWRPFTGRLTPSCEMAGPMAPHAPV